MAADLVGLRIKHYRLLRGMTQRQLAERAGVLQSLLSQCESGARRGDIMQVKTLLRIALVLDVSMDVLCGRYDAEIAQLASQG